MNYISEKKIFDISTEKTRSDSEIQVLLEQSSSCIGEINYITSGFSDYSFIIQVMRNIESLTSARIEGTTGNLQDLYLEDTMAFERKKQLKLFSAVNYKSTMNMLEDVLNGQPKISKLIIRQLHELLTKNDPFTSGTPGQFRKNDVIIRNSKLGDFTPANPLEINHYVGRLIAETINDKKMPSLFRACMSHYQFEAIHPFEDGNGRTGRLLINAQLLSSGMLSEPVLNLSQYFEEKRDEYLYALRSVSLTKSYTHYVKFFLGAIIKQCERNKQLIRELRELREKELLLINESTRSQAAGFVHEYALKKMYVSVAGAATHLKKKRLKTKDYNQSASLAIKKLCELNILQTAEFKFGKARAYIHVGLADKLLGKHK
jgi:Fic family protein